MYSLVGYGSDDEGESERYGQQSSVGGGGARRKEDDTNYESVNMDMSEESQGAESEPELPQVDSGGPRPPPRNDRHSNDSRENERERNRERDRERERDKERARERERERRNDERASPRREERAGRSERTDRRRDPWPRRGLLGDRPDDRPADRPDRPGDRPDKPGDRPDRPGDGWDGKHAESSSRSQDMRDAVSPRFVDRERTDRDRRERGDRDRERERDRDRERERDRDREGRSRRSEDRRSGRDRREDRSRSRGAAFPPPQSSSDRRGSPSGDYRPSSYKVSKKLEVMEKMGLQIKTPDGSMTTAQQLRAAAGDSPRPLSALGAPGARVLQQVQKRKLLWANKNKTENEAAKWSGTKFAQDSDGKQVSKFMRLMGIKDPAAINEPGEPDADPNKKQEELFQAMQAQYDVARATTHTMRGVGLGFQRSQF